MLCWTMKRWCTTRSVSEITLDGFWAALNIKMAAMLTAIVFVKAEVARIPEVAEEIAALSGVSEVYSVTGTIDLIVMIRVANHDQIAEVVADRLNKVSGVVSTETHIAFRAYSAHDLEAAFSLGG
jgi:DNA-binding Lrp family transcriptional regulator